MPVINIPAVEAAMKGHGLSGRKLAERIGVSPQTVANWLASAAFPHPAQLLKLSLSLRIPFDSLVLPEAPQADEPRVAARARLNRPLSDATLAELKGMGKMLEHLSDFLPFETLELPPRLVAPSLSYKYLQQVSKMIRSEIKKSSDEPLKIIDLVNRFSTHKAILIPVLWGQKEGHENAVHVFLPKSGTTWVYLNLDTYLPDFMFWMAHELGHVYSPSLEGMEAEKFADAFAGTLLFPEGPAKLAYQDLKRLSSTTSIIRVLNRYADEYGISSYSVYKEANNYASCYELPEIQIAGSSLHVERRRRDAHHGTMTELFWEDQELTPKNYIGVASKMFSTPFFDTLQRYLVSRKRTASFVQSALDIPLLDAKALHRELVSTAAVAKV